ncbi:MAG: protein-export chaperone SecB [Alphaproteobacteria bacterium]
MADEPSAPDGATPDDDELISPQIGIEAQYIKDLSFENPLGPNAAAAIQTNPEVSVEVTTSARPLEGERYEVTLLIRGEARAADSTVFILELTYGGVFTLANVPDDAISPILMIEGARLLFPFARNIVADISRDGGFPPLFINPIDFVELYQQQHMTGDNGDNGAAPDDSGTT